MVDAAYDELYSFLRPGVRENECVGLVAKVLYDLGSEHVEGVNAISGERCAPHPHVYSDRILRPGDPAFFDILHSYNGYRTCYYRCFAVGSASPAMRDAYRRCRDYMDEAIALVKPGATTADIVSVWPRAEEFGFPNEEAAFALQYGHGVGLSIWEKPIFSRLVSLDHPEVLEEGMLFALETYWPAADGWSAARIEEEVVVTADGGEVVTKFPAEELLIAGQRYWAVDGPLPTVREAESHRNRPAGGAGSRSRGMSVAHDTPTPRVPEGQEEPPVELLLELFEQMAVIRATEKAAYDLFMSGLVKGTTHLASGQEAVAVGASAALRPDDYVFATYRGHHHAMARGATPEACLAELMSRATGLCGGQGRLHAPHLGAAQHARLLRDRRLAPPDRLRRGLVGQAARPGPGRGRLLRRRRHQHRRLPRGAQPGRGLAAAGAVRLREQPLHGVHADRLGHRRGPPAADRAPAYDLPAELVDGNDVVAVLRRCRAPPPGPAPAAARR